MSRIIVRNLPDAISKDTLRGVFSQKGVVTDVQLKYTKTGKFRKFAFIGFKDADQAEAALSALNKTYINASQITIEICTALSDASKPRAWSQHNPESSAFKSKHKKDVPEKEDVTIPLKKKKSKISDPKVEALLKEHKDDKLFKEFIESHLPDDEALLATLQSDDEGRETSKKVADHAISDLDYLKSKVSQKLTEEDQAIPKVKKVKDDVKRVQLFTLKLIGLPFKSKKSDVKKFLKPAAPFSIRIPTKVKGIAYCGFKTEADSKKALVKNRSFLNGKRITVMKYENKTVGNDVPDKWREQNERLKNQEGVSESGRIFLRNLAYTVTEDDIKPLFEKYGPLSEVILPIDEFSRKPKGFGIVTFMIPEHACRAFNELDGTVLQGRMLHLLPGLPGKAAGEAEEVEGSFKEKKLQKQKKSAGDSVNWNTFFVSENRLAEAMAATYSTSKEKVLDDSGGGAAVRLALGETQVVSETKRFLEDNGVSLKAFRNMAACPRSTTTILVKNLPAGSESAELRDKFAALGELKRFLLPPSGTAALVEFIEPSEAKKAFKRLAYTRFKHLPLYLEWAPESVFARDVKATKAESKGEPAVATPAVPAAEPDTTSPAEQPTDTNIEGSTIFVKNLKFSTNEQQLRKHFSKCGAVVSATIAQKLDPSKVGQKLSLGYGFVTFATKESADTALKTLQFSTLDDHRVELKRSNRATESKSPTTRKTTQASGKPSTKILVRNVPFQATQKEIMQLFKTFGEIRALRLPRKMVGSGPHRGFCFVEFHTVKEAKLAFDALSQSTHLYGRRLVLEWAAVDDDVDTIRQKTAKRFRHFNSSDKPKKKNITIEDIKDEGE